MCNGCKKVQSLDSVLLWGYNFKFENESAKLQQLQGFGRFVCMWYIDDDARIVMEATGIYHLPAAIFLREQGLFVSIINPYEMKVYRSQDIRKVKTDKRDSMVIANYGVDKWLSLREFTSQEDVYAELRLLGRQYRFYMESRIEQLLNLTHLLDYTMPGLKSCFSGWSEYSGKDKLFAILTRMKELAKTLPEYPVVRAMSGVGDVFSVKLIGTNRHITKRGSSTLRKIGYEVMRCVKANGRAENDLAVYDFMIKKESEGKAKKRKSPR